MIIFNCPGCHAKLQVSDEHAGKTMRCPNCKHTATIPNAGAISAEPIPAVLAPATTPATASDDRDADGPRHRRDNRDEDRPRPKSGISAVVIALAILGVGFFCGCPILIALLVPAVQKVREAAARTQSTNNLKEIGLGFHSYHDAHKRLPFNGCEDDRHKKVAGEGFGPSGSWGYQILPYVNNTPLFQSRDPNVGVATYLCPGRGRPVVEAGKGAWSDYFYNNFITDPENASKPDRPSFRTLVGITDGTSNTILVGHGNIATTQYKQAAGVTGCSTVLIGGTIGTMRSGDDLLGPIVTGVTLARDSATPPTVGSWGGPFPVALMCMADGTVRNFPYQTANFGAFLTPNSNDTVSLPDER
ncbi:MAG TPA: DUF1559 domain-containing protein [Gemmataceae bacterium]|nr:DUF1559 domain-containing protein [Gemmataceae bacterium]